MGVIIDPEVSVELVNRTINQQAERGYRLKTMERCEGGGWLVIMERGE
jgi:hypothetical protein